MQMLRDRGYVVDESDLRMTRKDFVQKFGENIKKEDLLILTSKKNDSSDQVCSAESGHTIDFVKLHKVPIF